MNDGHEFILKPRELNGDLYHIPKEDFGRRMLVKSSYSEECKDYWAEFADGKPSLRYACAQRGWYVYEDMMAPIGGPW